MKYIKIEPCPFCGSSDTKIYYNCNESHVSCENCIATGPVGTYDEAIIRWNEVSDRARSRARADKYDNLDKLIATVNRIADAVQPVFTRCRDCEFAEKLLLDDFNGLAQCRCPITTFHHRYSDGCFDGRPKANKEAT